MKRFLFLILIVSFNISASDEGIQQWVYNTLERAQANLDKGNIEAAEKFIMTTLMIPGHQDHMIILYFSELMHIFYFPTIEMKKR